MLLKKIWSNGRSQLQIKRCIFVEGYLTSNISAAIRKLGIIEPMILTNLPGDFTLIGSNRFAGVESDILLTFAWIELSALSDTLIYPKALKELIHHIAADAIIKHVVNHDWVSSNDE